MNLLNGGVLVQHEGRRNDGRWTISPWGFLWK